MDKDEDPCEICETNALHTPNTHVETANSPPLLWECPHCGNYKVSNQIASNLKQLRAMDRPKVFGWIRKQNREIGVPHITTAKLDCLLSRQIPSLEERAEAILLEARQGQPDLEVQIRWDDPKFKAASYTSLEENNDMDRLIKLLKEQKILETCNTTGASISTEGHILIEQLLGKQ